MVKQLLNSVIAFIMIFQYVADQLFAEAEGQTNHDILLKLGGLKIVFTIIGLKRL